MQQAGKAEAEPHIRDITGTTLIKLKALCFLVSGLLAVALLLLDKPTFRTAALLAVVIWSFCRLYYFAFYVLERYLPGSKPSSGLFALITRKR